MEHWNRTLDYRNVHEHRGIIIRIRMPVVYGY